MRLLFAFLVVAGSLVTAQVHRDFSGVYLQKGTRYGKDISDPAVPRKILDVQQSTDEIIIRAIRNGEIAIAHFPFHSTKSDRTRARWKGRTLLLEASNSVNAESTNAAVIQKWQLSPDAQELMIHDNRVTGTIGSSYSEIYTRQPSLEAAQRTATMNVDQICNQSMQQWFSMGKARQTDFKQGAELGVASFQQVTRCVLYDAVLSGDFFKNLERDNSRTKGAFRKADQLVSTFSGDLTLEIGPHPGGCSRQNEEFVSQGPLYSEPVKDLRFMVRWMGSEVRDLGEVDARLLTEPWREQWPSDVFYRMTIPAAGVPLTDDLEILIFSKSGEQLACVKGHI